MTVGGDVLKSDGSLLEHFGVRGMRWGVRKSNPGREQERRVDRAVRDERKSFRRHTRISVGEVIVAGLVAGPVGILGYALIKRSQGAKLAEGEALAASIARSSAASTRYSETKQVGNS